MKLSIATLALAIASANGAVTSLTPENWDSLTGDKTVFVKFFAPWCGHCKKMAPDWEKLAGEWEGNDVGLVAEVDCTAEGKPLCDQNGVQGFPTIKYGDPAGLEDYDGGRTFDDFSSFAKENLKPVCSPAKLELCEGEKKEQIEKYMAMPAAELADAVAGEEKKMEEAETNFETEVQKLQEKYEALMKEKEDTAKEIKAKGLGLMKSVIAFNVKKEESKDE